MNIPVDELLAGIGTQVGLNPEEIMVVRYRGNSSLSNVRFKIKPSREDIVIWERVCRGL